MGCNCEPSSRRTLGTSEHNLHEYGELRETARNQRIQKTDLVHYYGVGNRLYCIMCGPSWIVLFQSLYLPIGEGLLK